MTEIRIDSDTVSALWTGKRGRGSLFQIMAVGNCELVNQLDLLELSAVVICVKHLPFPLGNGPTFYREVLEKVRGSGESAFGEEFTLGQIRKYLVHKAGDGCNAPHDTYLTIAVEAQKSLVAA